MRLLLAALLVANSALVCHGKDLRTESPISAAKLAPARSWSDSTGRYHMEGIFLGCERSLVRLQKVQGPVIAVPLSRLSAADRQYVLSILKSQGTPLGQTPPAASDQPASNADHSTRSDAGNFAAAWLEKLPSEWSSVTISPVGGVNELASAGRLMIQSDPPVPENMIYVRLSKKFLEQTACRKVSQHAAVHDTVLGYPIAGVSRTVGSAHVELQPSDRFGHAEIRLIGKTTYNTVADAWPIRVYTSGVTHFASAKAIRFDGQGIHVGPAVTNAKTSSTITGIDTSLPGLRGRIALRIGGARAAESRSAAAAVTARHTERRVDQEFDASASEEFAKLSKSILAQLAALPADHPFRKCRWQVSTTKDALRIVILSPAAEQNHFVPAPLPMQTDADVEVQIHGAVVRREMADVRLQSLLHPATVQFASWTGSTPGRRPSIQWSNDHQWMSVSWSSADPPRQPTSPRAASVASQGR